MFPQAGPPIIRPRAASKVLPVRVDLEAVVEVLRALAPVVADRVAEVAVERAPRVAAAVVEAEAADGARISTSSTTLSC